MFQQTVQNVVVQQPVQNVITLMRGLGVTPSDVAVSWGREPEITLRQAMDAIEAHSGRPLAGQYPAGRRYLLDGLTDGTGAVIVHPHGEAAVSAFTAEPVAADVDRLERRHGASEQLVRAAKRVSAALVSEHYLAVDPLRELRTPSRRGPTRDQALTKSEIRNYCYEVLRCSRDPALDALTWVFLRTSAARSREVIRLDTGGVHQTRPSVTLDGKGGRRREMPCAQPLVDRMIALSQARPARPGAAAVLRTQRGAAISTRMFEKWSAALHAHCRFAAGHHLRVHCLRHTTARLVYEAVGGNSVAAGLYLGHDLKQHLGTIACYLHSPYADAWSLRRDIYERVFGPLDAWPRLPELDLLMPDLTSPL